MVLVFAFVLFLAAMILFYFTSFLLFFFFLLYIGIHLVSVFF